MNKPGCTSVRLDGLLWEQEAAGSNPATPTNATLTQLVDVSALEAESYRFESYTWHHTYTGVV